MFLLTLETELEMRMVEKIEDSLPDPPLLWPDRGCLETLKRCAQTSICICFHFVVTRTPFERLMLKEGCVLKECKGRKCIFILHSSPSSFLCVCFNHGMDRSASVMLSCIRCCPEGVRQGCNPKHMEKNLMIN